MSQRVLLDTHAFLWMMQGYENLSQTAVDLIENPENQWFLSVASVWEITIKSVKGKLKVSLPISRLIEKYVEGNSIELVKVTAAHFDALHGLPHHHRDPFDRLIIAQAQSESLTLLSRDGHFAKYNVNVVW